MHGSAIGGADRRLGSATRLERLAFRFRTGGGSNPARRDPVQVVAPVESMLNLAQAAGGVLRELRGVVGSRQSSLAVAEDGLEVSPPTESL
jgi:hypothetical protein